MFGDIEIKKKTALKIPLFQKMQILFRKCKYYISDKLLVSNKIFLMEEKKKCFIGCLYDNYKTEPLHIMLHETSVYVNNYDKKTNQIYFLLKMITY